MQIHVVSPGQTLYEIGRLYGIAPGFIARYNGLREPYRLAVGQALLILRPERAVSVQQGDTLYSVARAAGIDPLELLRMNPNLGGQARLYPGQVLVTQLEESRTRPIEVSGYAYPYVNVPVLRGILPFASNLVPFTYGFTAQGELVGMDDEPLIALARLYGVRPLMHLSTLTESGSFSSERAAQLFADPQAEQTLMNTAPYYEDGSAEGNVMIVNEAINNYPQKVEFIRNDTQEVIYASNAIPVGSKIERAKLDVELPAGTYQCTAMFHNLDPASGDILGTAGAIITITIQN